MSIYFHGASSDSLRLYVEKYPARPIPKRKIERFSVPGRSGDIIVPYNAFENVKRVYECYLSADVPGRQLPEVAAAFVNWLSYGGYSELWDDYDPDFFYLATCVSGGDIENIQNLFGRIRIEFDCKPQRFLKSGKLPISCTNGETIVNPTPYTALPLIEVTGTSSSGSITIGNATLTMGRCDAVTIDCDSEDVYRISGGSVSNLNTAVSGMIPSLLAGGNAVSFSGGVSSLKITPRWWVL